MVQWNLCLLFDQFLQILLGDLGVQVDHSLHLFPSDQVIQEYLEDPIGV